MSHLESIDMLGTDIKGALVGASINLFTDKSHYDKHRPGWNDYCKAAHSQAWEAYLLFILS